MARGLYVLSERAYEIVYGPTQRAAIESLVEIVAEPLTVDQALRRPELLSDIDVIFSGWGGPKIGAEFLSYAKKLKAVFYAAGSVKPIVTEEFWERGLRISSAYGVNAIPVGEYVLAMIILGLKRAFALNRQVTAARTFTPLYLDSTQSVPGTYGTTVGVVSLGMAGRQVCGLLKNLDIRILGFDPYVSEEAAQALGVDRLCSLDEIFAESNAVTLHTPWLPETEKMIRGHHILSMKSDAVFVNASRGAVVDEAELAAALRQRPDIQAILDVSEPEPPVSESPLYDLPNLFLTPHIAGSAGSECHRMAQAMYEECCRFLAGDPLQWEITRDKLKTLA